MRTELGARKLRKAKGNWATYCKENPEVKAEYDRLVLEGVANRIGSTADGGLPDRGSAGHAT